jgi:hypothetical protein
MEMMNVTVWRCVGGAQTDMGRRASTIGPDEIGFLHVEFQ